MCLLRLLNRPQKLSCKSSPSEKCPCDQFILPNASETNKRTLKASNKPKFITQFTRNYLITQCMRNCFITQFTACTREALENVPTLQENHRPTSDLSTAHSKRSQTQTPLSHPKSNLTQSTSTGRASHASRGTSGSGM